jgi:hypothetical protein
LVAGWTFETSVPATAGPHAAEAGVNAGAGSAALGSHADATTVYSNPVGPASLESFSADKWTTGDYWQFSTSTTGYRDVTVSFDATGSNTGPRDFKIAWSADNLTYSDFGTYSLVNASWSSSPTFVNPPTAHFSFDFSSVSALEEDSSIFFRLIQVGTTSINAGTVAATGTSRVDNFMINAAAVPEPAAVMFGVLICGVVGFSAAWRRYFGEQG